MSEIKTLPSYESFTVQKAMFRWQGMNIYLELTTLDPEGEKCLYVMVGGAACVELTADLNTAKWIISKAG